MISALLLPLLFAGVPADSLTASQTPAPDDDPAIRLWINNDRRFLAGDRAKVEVRSHDDGYLIVLHADPDGLLRVLFPVDPRDDNFVRGGRKYEVKGRGGHESFHVDVSSGRGTVYAAVSAAPLRFDEFVAGDHWDYRTLAPNRLPREPETELTELVRRMAQGSFDYDLLTYDVIERVVYAADRSYSSNYYYDSFYNNDPWCGGYYYRHCGSGFSIGLFFGRPYRRAYYGPFYHAYDPFYDPFFYDPFYYRPIYRPYRPYYYRPYYGYPYYGGSYYNRPYTPYRFRGTGGALAGYRDRRYDLRRSVNTVYSPPVTRLREDASSSPVRRAVERRESSSTGQAEARREGRTVERREPELRRRATPTDGGTPSMERRPIEARRARNPERALNPASEARERRDLPQEIQGRRRDDDRPAVQRAPERAERQQP
ncbi:MAG: DUF4384 domain-containing protein, partial [Gemmatimonadales bacterium]